MWINDEQLRINEKQQGPLRKLNGKRKKKMKYESRLKKQSLGKKKIKTREKIKFMRKVGHKISSWKKKKEKRDCVGLLSRRTQPLTEY